MAAHPQEIFNRFVEIVRMLRDPAGGCPWDLKQTHISLKPYLIEEAYEVLEAIEAGDDPELCGELGDLLLQVVLHAQLANERKAFTIDDVVRHIADKMIRRHPHVFENAPVSGVEEVLKNWEQIKLEERKSTSKIESTGTPQPVSVISGVPKSMPALLRAQRIGEKAAKVGFDWESSSAVLAKINEEIDELKAEIKGGGEPPDRRVEEELGDILFAVCQLARFHGLNAEESLHRASSKFCKRFLGMEELADKPLSEYCADELDQLWEKAKKLTPL